MSVTRKSLSLLGVLLACAASIAPAQISPAVQVPLELANGWGPVKPPAGYKALRIQGRSTADLFVLARLFADFARTPPCSRALSRVSTSSRATTRLCKRAIVRFLTPGRAARAW
jgi:hypothetical protein